MPAGSPVNDVACAYTLCVIEQARTVMADKEGHFISGSSLILMKTSHLTRAQWHFIGSSGSILHTVGPMLFHSSTPGFILPLLLMTANDPRRAIWYAHFKQCVICMICFLSPIDHQACVLEVIELKEMHLCSNPTRNLCTVSLTFFWPLVVLDCMSCPLIKHKCHRSETKVTQL